MLVYKFGGASVNSSAAVRNVAEIVQRKVDTPLIVVISAMGKTTNALEQLVPGVGTSTERQSSLASLRDYHYSMALDLLHDPSLPLFSRLDEIFAKLEFAISASPSTYNADYDRVVSYGELLSTTIVSCYLTSISIRNKWLDARQLLRTNNAHREGIVDWNVTMKQVSKCISCDEPVVYITQGFIAGADDGTTTTLGREGSDYSAAVLAYCTNASEVVIWKDVPGFLNADPKYFPDTVKINRMPYNEAIELSYFGASVIHPKTVKPLQNKNIPLQVRSFLNPEAKGSLIGPFDNLEPQTPLYIVRYNQVLISITPRDFSFITEDNLQRIFGCFAAVGMRVNCMQNSALSFSVCVDYNEILLADLTRMLQASYQVRYNKDLQLITIRYYTKAIIDDMVAGRLVLLQQCSRSTAQLLVQG
ncbi:MAG: aspartate kinase [Bacteroidales bacterium]|nr:aspartate kinase [Candidatus Colimorpha onthohippi]